MKEADLSKRNLQPVSISEPTDVDGLMVALPKEAVIDGQHITITYFRQGSNWQVCIVDPRFGDWGVFRTRATPLEALMDALVTYGQFPGHR